MLLFIVSAAFQCVFQLEGSDVWVCVQPHCLCMALSVWCYDVLK